MYQISHDSLVSYLYNEPSVYETIEIEEALDSDIDLEAAFHDLNETFEALPAVKKNPSFNVVRNILDYSESKLLA